MLRKNPPETALVPVSEVAEGLTAFEVDPAAAGAAERYARSANAPNTARARTSDWKVFETWCAERRLATLPASPETVAAFLASQSQLGKAVATIARYSQSIAAVHRLRGATSPTDHEGVRIVLRGIRRERGVRQTQKAAFEATFAPSNDDSLLTKRNRALLLLGFACAMRRSELCALDVEDLTFVKRGVFVGIRRSKTDQEGKGRVVAVERVDDENCPVRALTEWLDATHIETGPLFRAVVGSGVSDERLGDRSVARAVKAAVASCGLDAKKFAGHSLRSGFVTTMRKNGATFEDIAQQTGHKSLEMVKRYLRYSPDAFDAVGKLFKGNK